MEDIPDRLSFFSRNTGKARLSREQWDKDNGASGAAVPAVLPESGQACCVKGLPRARARPLRSMPRPPEQLHPRNFLSYARHDGRRPVGQVFNVGLRSGTSLVLVCRTITSSAHCTLAVFCSFAFTIHRLLLACWLFLVNKRKKSRSKQPV